MPGWLNKEKTAVDTCILDIPLALSRKFLPKVRGVLVLDVLYDGIPAAVVSNSHL
jgi:hypothetical protein